MFEVDYERDIAEQMYSDALEQKNHYMYNAFNKLIRDVVAREILGANSDVNAEDLARCITANTFVENGKYLVTIAIVTSDSELSSAITRYFVDEWYSSSAFVDINGKTMSVCYFVGDEQHEFSDDKRNFVKMLNRIATCYFNKL